MCGPTAYSRFYTIFYYLKHKILYDTQVKDIKEKDINKRKQGEYNGNPYPISLLLLYKIE